MPNQGPSQLNKNDWSGRKDSVVSSHTFLVQLSDNCLEGGATRFYRRQRQHQPRNSISSSSSTFASSNSTATSMFSYQRDGLWPFVHEGCCILFLPHDTWPRRERLQALPEETLLKPSFFKNGPGVTMGAFY